MSYSMTGFGSAEREIEGLRCSVEIRTVNNRYLKISTRIDDCLTAITPGVEELVKNRFQRGTVNVAIRTKMVPTGNSNSLDTELIQSYVQQLQSLLEDQGQSLSIDLASLLVLPGVIASPSPELTKEMTDALLTLVGEALDGVALMRQKEGQTIIADLHSNIEVIRQCLKQVRNLAPGVIEDYHRRLTDRVMEFSGLSEAGIDCDSLAREVAIFAERCDIAEEISRLSAHLDEFETTCEQDLPKGRKLDFIAQELLREANTIASKSNSGEISRLVVDIKTAVDRLKEQVANLE